MPLRTNRPTLFVASLLALVSTSSMAHAAQNSSFATRPRLVVAISIDQFRADTLTRFTERFLPAREGRKLGGFRFLMEP